ncbi:MAG: hypothetical protein IPL26_25220 [Leptospiraceae bacterium]|nr:hypothetical protein [Leptospiraceae bacterium]
MKEDYSFFGESIPSESYYITSPESTIDYKLDKIHFKREENLRLKCFYNGKGLDSWKQLMQMRNFPSLGTVIKGQENPSIKATSSDFKQEVEFKYISDITTHTEISGEFRGTGEPHEIIIRDTSNYPPRVVIYWIGNAEEEHNFYYTRKFILRSNPPSITMFGTIDVNESSHYISGNRIDLKLNEENYIFGKIPKSLTQAVNKSFLYTDGTHHPNLKFCAEFCSIMGYLMGLKLYPLGYTFYTDEFQIIEKGFWNVTNVEKADTNWQIIPLDLRHDKKRINNPEAILSNLIENFFEKKESFQLMKILGYFQKFYELPFYLRIQTLATGLDLLEKFWYKSKLSKSRGKYMEDNTYKVIIEKYISNIEEDIKEIANQSYIINNIRNANQISLTQKKLTFVQELEMRLTDNEKKILKKRNSAVHGSDSEVESQAIVSDVGAYYSLVSRIFLKFLGYDDNYIDYSLPNYPAKNIEISVGEIA